MNASAQPNDETFTEQEVAYLEGRTSAILDMIHQQPSQLVKPLMVRTRVFLEQANDFKPGEVDWQNDQEAGAAFMEQVELMAKLMALDEFRSKTEYTKDTVLKGYDEALMRSFPEEAAAQGKYIF